MRRRIARSHHAHDIRRIVSSVSDASTLAETSPRLLDLSNNAVHQSRNRLDLTRVINQGVKV
jgi:hypothetical protein